MVIAWVLMWIVIGYASLVALQPRERPLAKAVQTRPTRAR